MPILIHHRLLTIPCRAGSVAQLTLAIATLSVTILVAPAQAASGRRIVTPHHPSAHQIWRQMRQVARREGTAHVHTFAIDIGNVHYMRHYQPRWNKTVYDSDFVIAQPLREHAQYVETNYRSHRIGVSRLGLYTRGSRAVVKYGRGTWVARLPLHRWVCTRFLQIKPVSSLLPDMRGLNGPNFPLEGNGHWIEWVRFVKPTRTFGEPSWWIRVRYNHEIGLWPMVNEYVSRSDYHLLRVVVRGHFQVGRRGDPVFWSTERYVMYERFTRYGQQVNLRPPITCPRHARQRSVR